MKMLPVIAVVALGLSAPGLAESPADAPAADADTSSRRTINVIVYGEDSCPQGQGDEIVVCARHPESERYRIPKKLRAKPDLPANQSWTSRLASIEERQRDELPTGCSVTGGTIAGCFAKAMRQWSAERRMAQSGNQP